ncbi:formyltetrahydrofolate deformylase [Caballeronia sp. LZ065]|uniref:formyltetrahydrofolate deformylase n=1 Tax=Caballeronia sp. LZ065 TaxID=3038571 RepID=UPI00285D28DC|nr:formyltetrahydrofolate deformylase [Caballeronia sp. LZ065]MDR5783847.1 formyltetrahydrofolate deformylase [Caballeronia sp. LZ065]
MTETCILTLQCDDRPGLVAAVSACLAAHGGNIVAAAQFNDRASNRFFMRTEFDVPDADLLGAIERDIGGIARPAGMQWKLRRKAAPVKVLFLVSKLDHCLGDLLYRRRIGELAMDVVGIVGNHPREAVTISLSSGVPYHHLPVTRDTKPQQEAQIRGIVEETGAELVVLARYMQVLSDRMAGFLAGRCINIHHSFLPGFKGAKPYHQAHARGVKMIGATAHYVTADLDEGPIIHQDVEPITHADEPDDLVRKGRDIERRVLSEAVRLHVEDRVLLSGSKTIVFRD